MGQAGFPEVHLVIDQSRHQQLVGEVVFLVGLGAGGDDADALDAPGPDEEVCSEATTFVDDLSVAEDDGAHTPSNQTSSQPTANGKTPVSTRDLHHVRKVGFLDAFRVDVDGGDPELGLLVLQLQDEIRDD